MQGNVRTDVNNTYDAGTTQSMPALEVNGVDVTTKNQEQDQATADAANAASVADGKAAAAQSTANTANTKASANSSSIGTINSRPYVTSDVSTTVNRVRIWSNGNKEIWGRSQVISNPNTGTISLPSTMPSNRYSLITSYDDGLGGGRFPIITGNQTTTSFEIVAGNGNTTFSYYIASI